MWINVKRKVVAFIKEWCDIAKDAFYEDILIKQLLNVFIYVSFFNCQFRAKYFNYYIKELLSQIKIDIKINMSLKEELKTLEMIIEGDPLSYM